MNPDDFVLPFILVAFPIFFCLIWSLVLFICSYVGGWHRLSSEFAIDNPDGVEWHGFQRGQVGLIEMKSTFWIAVSPKGLYLKTGPGPLFRFMHPPLLIPWHKVSEVKDVNKIFFSGTSIKVEGVTITLPREIMNGAKQHIAVGKG